VTLCSTIRERGQGRSLANLRAFTNFTKIRCIRRSRAFSRHAQTCICDRDRGYRPVKFTCDVAPRSASLDNFSRARMFSLVRWIPDSAKGRELLILSAFCSSDDCSTLFTPQQPWSTSTSSQAQIPCRRLSGVLT
jgi:hypothetical protein